MHFAVCRCHDALYQLLLWNEAFSIRADERSRGPCPQLRRILEGVDQDWASPEECEDPEARLAILNLLVVADEEVWQAASAE